MKAGSAKSGWLLLLADVCSGCRCTDTGLDLTWVLMLDLIQILDNACIAEQDTAVGVTAVDCHDRYALQQVRFGAISLLSRDDQITLCGLTCLLSR